MVWEARDNDLRAIRDSSLMCQRCSGSGLGCRAGRVRMAGRRLLAAAESRLSPQRKHPSRSARRRTNQRVRWRPEPDEVRGEDALRGEAIHSRKWVVLREPEETIEIATH